MTLDIEEIPIGNYMTAYPISVRKDVSIFDATNFMARHDFGNLIVSDGDDEREDGQPLGIISERDIMREIAKEKTLPDKQVRDIQYTNFEKITPGISVLEAARIMISKKARLLVFANSNKLVGIVTASDMLRAFRKTYVAPSLDEVISKHVYQSSYTENLITAISRMYEKGIGSLIIQNDDGKLGIFTERDMLTKILPKRLSLDEKIGSYSSFPLITSREGILGNEAASIMAKHNIKRLALQASSSNNNDNNDGSITGIITARDLVDAYQSNAPMIRNY